MSSIPATVLLRFWLVLIAFWLSGQAWAAPDYVTAWPKQVQVEKSDPVLGDKPFWEHWVYGEAFAKRFRGFPVENADAELKGKLQATVMRIYMRNLWSELNPNYPKQYACEIDLYFDNTITIPLSESGKPRRIYPDYPKGVSESFRRLDPVSEADKTAMKVSTPAASNMKKQPMLFATPLDGRFTSFGVREYHANFVPGLAVISLSSGTDCAVTAPLRVGGAHWLSLLGERPYSKDKDGDDQSLWLGMEGGHRFEIRSVFDPGPNPDSKGYFRVPGAFNKAALPKATLVKMLNWCINQKFAHSTRGSKSAPPEVWAGISHRCRDAEEHGKIDPGYPGKEGLQDLGF